MISLAVRQRQPVVREVCGHREVNCHDSVWFQLGLPSLVGSVGRLCSELTDVVAPGRYVMIVGADGVQERVRSRVADAQSENARSIRSDAGSDYIDSDRVSVGCSDKKSNRQEYEAACDHRPCDSQDRTVPPFPLRV